MRKVMISWLSFKVEQQLFSSSKDYKHKINSISIKFCKKIPIDVSKKQSIYIGNKKIINEQTTMFKLSSSHKPSISRTILPRYRLNTPSLFVRQLIQKMKKNRVIGTQMVKRSIILRINTTRARRSWSRRCA